VLCPKDATPDVFAALEIDEALVTTTPEHVNVTSMKDPSNVRRISLLLESMGIIGFALLALLTRDSRRPAAAADRRSSREAVEAARSSARHRVRAIHVRVRRIP
jgi:hypothetical protein